MICTIANYDTLVNFITQNKWHYSSTKDIVITFVSHTLHYIVCHIDIKLIRHDLNQFGALFNIVPCFA